MNIHFCAEQLCMKQFRFSTAPRSFLTNQDISNLIGQMNPSCLSITCVLNATLLKFKNHREGGSGRGGAFVCVVKKNGNFLLSLSLKLSTLPSYHTFNFGIHANSQNKSRGFSEQRMVTRCLFARFFLKKKTIYIYIFFQHIAPPNRKFES